MWGGYLIVHFVVFLKIIFFLSTHLTPNQKVENDLDSRILVSDFEKLLFFI